MDIQYAQFDGTRQWIEDLPKLAVYFFNDTTNGWSGLVQTVADTYIYTIPANLNFTPTKMIACRMNPAATEANWSSKWNQTADLSFGDVAIVADDLGVSYPTTKGLASEIKLDNYHRSDSGAPEFYKQHASLKENDAFEITYNGSKYHLLADGVDTTYFTIKNNKINCNLDGSYDLYFNASSDSHKLWAQVDADTEATGFASKFLNATNGICKDTSKGAEDTDVNALAAVWNVKNPADENSLVEKWNALTTGAKSSFAAGTANETIKDAHDRYLHIMERYSGTLTAFEGGPSASSNTSVTPASVQNVTNYVPVIIIISSIAVVTLLGAGLMIKRRKEDR